LFVVVVGGVVIFIFDNGDAQKNEAKPNPERTAMASRVGQSTTPQQLSGGTGENRCSLSSFSLSLSLSHTQVKLINIFQEHISNNKENKKNIL
jgi:hypothetical protein